MSVDDVHMFVGSTFATRANYVPGTVFTGKNTILAVTFTMITN